MAVPNTTIDGSVWGEWEYESIQVALGLPMRADAVGRMASLWQWCVAEETDVASEKVVEGKLGKGGAAALLDCGLGELVDGGIRVRGAAKRVSEWQERQGGWSRGGQKAAAKAKKVGRAGGKFRKADDQVTSCPPADDQLPPAQDQHVTRLDQPSASASSSPSDSQKRERGPDLHRGWANDLRQSRYRTAFKLWESGIGSHAPRPAPMADASVEIQALRLVQRWAAEARATGDDPEDRVAERGAHLVAVLEAQCVARKSLQPLRETTCWTLAVADWAETVSPTEAAAAPDRRAPAKSAPPKQSGLAALLDDIAADEAREAAP